jgi:zinc protease
MAKALLNDDSRVILATSPQKPGIKIPTDAELQAAMTAASAVRVLPWTDATTTRVLMEHAPAAGAISGRRSLDESLGITIVRFANGVEAWLKPTDFKNDQVMLSAYARGGTSTSPDAGYFDTALSASLVNLAGVGGMQAPEIASLLAGKVVSLSPFIDTSAHGIRGGSRPQDLEATFQLLYLTFTAPNGDTAALDLLKRQLNSLIVNRQQNPGAVFADRVRALNTGNSRYVRPITPEALGALKLDVMR